MNGRSVPLVEATAVAVRARVARAVILAGLALLLTAGCRRATTHPLASLFELHGAVETARGESWRPAELGLGLAAGDAVRTGADGDARLRFASGHELHIAARSLVRLGLDPSSSIMVTVELGEADLEADGQVVLGTARGPAHLSAGARVTVKVDERRARYEVSVGRAQIGEGPTAVAFGPGEGLALAFGSAEIERYKITVGSAEVEPLAPPVRPSDAAAAPDVGTAGPVRAPASGETNGPRRSSAVDVTLPAGETAVIHARAPSLTARLTLAPLCEQSAVVELTSRGSSRPVRQAVDGNAAALPLTLGRNHYRYRCASKTLAEGTLVVRPDDGRSPLSRTAPANTIEADGRRYTLLYQNRLPALTFVWPTPPASASYTLHVEGNGHAHDYPTRTPSLLFPSGTFVDGTYTWSFTTAEGKRSLGTTAVIRFDNSAVTAELEPPREASGADGSPVVEVAGVALLGSTVAVDGQPVAVDPSGRFKGEVSPPAGARSLAIRFQHPRGGIHYYLRPLAPVR